KVTTVNSASSQSTETRTKPRSAGRDPRGALAGARTASASAQGAVDVTIKLRTAGLAARGFQVQARAVLLGGACGLFGVPERARANDDQELGAVDAVALGAKGGAKHRDVAQERHLGLVDRIAFLDQATQRHRFPIHNRDGGPDAALLDGRGIDAGA